MKKIIVIPVTLSLMVFALGPGWAVAQTQTAGEGTAVQGLFTPVSPDALSVQSIQGETDRSVVRSRFVRVNLDHLTELESITLNLFDDVTIQAIREKVEQRSEGRYTWFGAVPGKEFSSVILTVENGDLVGGVRIDGKLYTVRPLEQGLHVVRQVDPKAFPNEDDDRSPASLPNRDFVTGRLPELQDQQLWQDDGSTIDIMVVYTDDVARALSNVGAEIQYVIDVTNSALEKSFVYTRLRLVHTAEVNYPEPGDSATTLNDLRNTANQYLKEIHTWREQYHADIVSLWVENLGGKCGRGEVFGPFHVVERSCARENFSMAHELGHNMGAGHDKYAIKKYGESDSDDPYAHGYNWTSWPYCRRTIMAYPDYCNDNWYPDNERIGRWSNPFYTWQVCEWPLDWPCTDRMPIGNEETANNVRELNENRSWVANYMQSNRTPVSEAGGPYLAECQGSSTILTLNGSGSTDPDGDPLTYSWTTDCPGGSFNNSTAPQPTLTVNTSALANLGCTVSLRVTDNHGLSSVSDSAAVTIQDTTPPVILCKSPATISERNLPVSFTATATDNGGASSVGITSFDCATQRGESKPRSCKVNISGSTITILDSGGPVRNISWTVHAADGSGNFSDQLCTVRMVKLPRDKNIPF